MAPFDGELPAADQIGHGGKIFVTAMYRRETARTSTGRISI
jgi:hypothetical protein